MDPRRLRGAAGAWHPGALRQPRVTDTPILGDFRASMGEEAIDRAVPKPAGWAALRTSAASIAFLLGPDAGWVNAVDLRVDGGLVGARLALPIHEGAVR